MWLNISHVLVDWSIDWYVLQHYVKVSVVELLVVVVLHDPPDEVVVDQAQTETKYTFKYRYFAMKAAIEIEHWQQ